MLDSVTLLVVAAITVAFSGALLVLAQGTSADGPTMRMWGASLLTGAVGLVVSASAQLTHWTGIEPCGMALFLLATSVAWVGARRFAGRAARPWWPLLPPCAWLCVAGLLHLFGAGSEDLRLALACWTGAGMTAAAAAELLRGQKERLPSLPAVAILLVVHAVVYVLRGVAACAGGIPQGWGATVMDAMVLESLLHAMGVAFLVVAMMKERTDLRSRNELRVLALSDGLTGVANRRHFDLILSFEAARVRRARDVMGLVMFDVDQFKRYNDALGHPQGDVCLCAVAGALGRVVPAGSMLARYGGEEFAILLPATSRDVAVQIAEAARQAVERLAMTHPAGGVVTVSVGVGTLSGLSGADGARALLASADRALYAAKAAGRNRVCGPPAHHALSGGVPGEFAAAG